MSAGAAPNALVDAAERGLVKLDDPAAIGDNAVGLLLDVGGLGVHSSTQPLVDERFQLVVDERPIRLEQLCA